MAATVVDSTSNTENDTAVTVTKPTGTADGHLLLAIEFGYFEALAHLTAAGFTERATRFDGSSRGGKVWSKVASSEGASYNFGTNGFDYVGVQLIAISDVDTTTNHGIEDVQSDIFSNNDDTAVCPSVTAATAGGLLICGAMGNSFTPSTYTTSWPGGMTELEDFRRPDGYDTYSSASEALVGSGATGTRIATFSTGATNAGGWVTFSIVVKSSAGGGGTSHTRTIMRTVATGT
jgi:hypothetical protein